MCGMDLRTSFLIQSWFPSLLQGSVVDPGWPAFSVEGGISRLYRLRSYCDRTPGRNNLENIYPRLLFRRHGPSRRGRHVGRISSVAVVVGAWTSQNQKAQVGNGAKLQPCVLVPNNLFPPARPCLLEVPQPPKRVLPTMEQV